jgi:hypothetical protein
MVQKFGIEENSFLKKEVIFSGVFKFALNDFVQVFRADHSD